MYSPEPVMVTFRLLLIFTAAILGIANMRMWWQSFSITYIFKKDFIQEFLISKSVLDGVDPYLPLPVLADRFLGPLPNLIFPHPTPHPPPVALLCLPFGLMSYEHAAIAWFFFELICLSVSVVLLLRWLGVEKRGTLLLLSTLLILVWAPVTYELLTGQLTAFLFFLMAGAWLSLRSGKDIRGGIFLGTAVAVKLVPWPLIIFLMLRRNWRAACAAMTTTVVANIAAATLIGFDRIAYYYLKIVGSVSELYRGYYFNFSLWTIGWRIFDGTGSQVLGGVNAPPLFNAPAIAPIVSIAISLTILIFGFAFAFKARNFDTSFGILVCLIILVSPVAWIHYLIITLIPFVIVLKNLSFLKWPCKETYVSLCIFFSFLISPPGLHRLTCSLTGNGSGDGLVQTCSFTVSLVYLLPTIALLGLICLVWRLDRAAP